MMADSEQMRFYPSTRSRDEASAWIERNIALYLSHGFGSWFIEDVRTRDFLGYAGIRPLVLDGAEEVEMVWHISKQHCNRGVATYAAEVCRDLAFHRFGIERLVATIDPAHAASMRVASRIGMEQEKGSEVDGWACLVYSLERQSSDG
jgi:RimJ/RimL family protein N-acetyltransferase